MLDSERGIWEQVWQRLMPARDEQGQALGDEQILAHLNTLPVAWTLYLPAPRGGHCSARKRSTMSLNRRGSSMLVICPTPCITTF